jgi:hypothetical protein
VILHAAIKIQDLARDSVVRTYVEQMDLSWRPRLEAADGGERGVLFGPRDIEIVEAQRADVLAFAVDGAYGLPSSG